MAKTKQNVFIITYCRKPELLYGTTLVFKTLRVGFPTAEINVIDNNSVPEVRERIKSLALENGCNFTQVDKTHPHLTHHALIERVVFSEMEGPCVFVDPDIVFWENCEQFEFDGFIGGRLIPMFRDDYSGCLTMPRLHTSFLYINKVEALRERLKSIAVKYFDFQPFTPYMFKVGADWWRADTGASLYSVLKDEVYCFGGRELDSYDHLFCGSHVDWVVGSMGEADRRDFERDHLHAQSDHRLLKGAWKRQDEYFRKREVTSSGGCVLTIEPLAITCGSSVG